MNSAVEFFEDFFNSMVECLYVAKINTCRNIFCCQKIFSRCLASKPKAIAVIFGVVRWRLHQEVKIAYPRCVSSGMTDARLEGHIGISF